MQQLRPDAGFAPMPEVLQFYPFEQLAGKRHQTRTKILERLLDGDALEIESREKEQTEISKDNFSKFIEFEILKTIILLSPKGRDCSRPNLGMPVYCYRK